MVQSHLISSHETPWLRLCCVLYGGKYICKHVSNEKKTCCLGCIGDYTTQLCGDCNKPSQRSLLNNLYNLESKRIFSWLMCLHTYVRVCPWNGPPFDVYIMKLFYQNLYKKDEGSPSWINHSKLSSLFQQFRCFFTSAFLLLTAESLVFEGPSAGKGPCLCQRALAISLCTLSQQGPVTNLGCITNA